MQILNKINKNVYKIKEFVAIQAPLTKNHSISSSLVLLTLLCLVPFIMVTFILILNISSSEFCHIFIEAEKGPRNIVNEKFISLGLDTSVITDGFKNFNMTDSKLIQMIKYLSPAYLRIGGNPADQLIFCNQNKSEDCSLKCESCIFNESDTFILKDSDWLKLHGLATRANVDVIFDLNSLLRHDDGSWDPKNAIEMIRFSQDNGLVLDWELGNEPNSYEHKYSVSVDPIQLGVDYVLLRSLLNQFELYKNSYLVGPSTTRLRTKQVEEYFRKFLMTGYHAVSAITWHHYYFSGMNATPSEFLDPYVFNYLYYCIQTVNSIVRDLKISKPVWLGETSSAWHAGAPGLSDRFIGCFIWIDKLGLSAQMGINVVVRQSIFKGHYALLNDSYYPNPDWWLSILYKKLVDTTVIGTSLINPHERIRLYAHCAKNNSVVVKEEENYHSSIVVFGLNIQDKTGFVKIENLKSDPSVQVYEVTSESNLFSQYVRLNGKILNLLPNLELPNLKPKIIIRDKVFAMPAYSVVFWVFTNTNVDACSK